MAQQLRGSQQAGIVVQPVRAVSRILVMLRGPQGAVDEMVLADGTMVRVPPRLQLICRSQREKGTPSK